MAVSNSSERGFLTAEELVRVQPWRPPPLGFDSLTATEAAPLPEAAEPKPPEPEPPEPDPPSLPTAAEIEAIQAQAREEGLAEGRREGLEQGRREGLETMRKRLEERLQRLDRLMAALAEPFAEMDEAVEQEILTLVTSMVRQLLRREIRTDPNQIVGVVREALSVLPVSARRVRLVLHPEDAAIVRELYALDENEPAWQIQEDPVLERGGCRVLSDDSQVDASLESRLNTLIAALFGAGRASDQVAADA